MFTVAGHSRVISVGSDSSTDKDQAKEDIHDWFRRSQTYVPLQGSGGPTSGREDHAVYGNHQQHVCKGSQVSVYLSCTFALRERRGG